MKHRSIHDLLLLLKRNKYLFRSGLCLMINDLYGLKIITQAELIALKNHIHTCHNGCRSLRVWENRVGYYWPLGSWTHRLRWINQEINKLKKNENT